MKVGLIQFDIAWNDPQTSLARAEPLVDKVCREGAELVLLPEMFTTGFSFPTGDLAINAFETGRLALVRWSETYQTAIAGSLPDPSANRGRPTNSLVVVSNSKILGAYEKIHLFSFAHEHDSYTPGTHLLTLTIAGVRCTFFVCYDLRFSEMWAAAAQQTDLFCLVANWPRKREGHWRTLLQSRAIDNQAFVVGVNRTGSGGDVEYHGGSLAVSPQGEILTVLGEDSAGAVIELSRTAVSEYRNSFPTLRDRRPELYDQFRTGTTE